jgi:hypothetical protein
MKEAKSSTVVGFLAGIVAAMLMFHIGTGGFSNRNNAAPQASAAFPTMTIAISPAVSSATTPERAQAFPKPDEADVAVRQSLRMTPIADKQLSESVSKREARATGPKTTVRRTPPELTLRSQAAKAASAPQGVSTPSGGATALLTTEAPPRKPSKMLKILGVLSKVVLATMIPGQTTIGNTLQAINQQSFPSTQTSPFPLPKAQALPVPMSPTKLPPQIVNSTGTSAAVGPAPAATIASVGKPNRLRRFFGVLGKAVRINVSSENATSGNTLRPVVTPILPPNTDCTLMEDRCNAHTTQMKAAQEPQGSK